MSEARSSKISSCYASNDVCYMSLPYLTILNKSIINLDLCMLQCVNAF